MSLPVSVPIQSTDVAGEQVRNLVGRLSAEAASQAERRKDKRIQYSKIAVLVLLDRPGGDTSFLVLTDNISRGGLAFKHASSLDIDTSCKIKIMLPSGELVVSEGRIVRCRPLSDRGYEVGIRFDRTLSVSLAEVEDPPS
jgi:hypothetical protein